jgi:hypothetical protein
MAFDLQYLQNFSGSGKGLKIWGYLSAADDATAINASGYFNTAADLLEVGDRIFCQATDGQLDLVVATISSGVVTTRGPGMQATATWDAASIADGDEVAVEVTVTGAELGDFVLASLSVDVADLVLSAAVTAANTVTAVLANNTGGAIDLASATLKVRVIK